jgi:C-terminal processing protease CtpA/Prc
VTARRVRLIVGAPIAAEAPIAPAAQAVMDRAVTLVKTRALKRDKVDWPATEAEVRVLAAGAEKSADVYPAIRYVLSQLGDRHSFLMPPVQSKAFQTGGAQNPIPEVRALASRVGYVSVPGYGGGDPAASRAYATQVHERISAAFSGAACGWVIDLRSNPGGNMWPMLAGLRPFLGNETLGSFDSGGGNRSTWRADQVVPVEPPAALSALRDAWIAVLTGPSTASSGEFVTIAFRGRPRTRSFGLPTAGLSTANSTLPLPDGAMLLLTESVGADRTGKTYGEKIDPDESVTGSATRAVADDAAAEAAIRWLKTSSACGSGV